MAAANNPDLSAAGYDPRISAEHTGQARAAFLPTLSSGIQRNVQQSPPSSVFLRTAAASLVRPVLRSVFQPCCASSVCGAT